MRALAIVLAIGLGVSTCPFPAMGSDEGSSSGAGSPGPAPGEASPEQLEELVSPIALYPDLLVARILVASTFPTQIVEAARWLQQNPDLKGDEFAKAVNGQPWDPSVRSLSQFREVIKTMNDSLAWTSSLGEAYYNQPDDVMDAIQRLRNRAVQAGTLKDTPQQKVQIEHAAEEPAQGGGAQQQVVVIEPAQQNTVYVPQYDSSSVYGAPVQAPAGYTSPPGYTGTELLTTGLLSFGLGMGLMALINEGDDDWDCGWGGSGGNTVNYNKNVYRNRGDNHPRGGRSELRQSRRGQAQRPTPYSGRGTRSPASRPYDPATARPYRPGGPSASKPVFPKSSTLPANRPVGAGAAGRRGGVAGGPSNPQQRMAQDRRGYGAGAPNRNTRGGRSGAFGSYAPGGATQAAGSRGRASFQGGRSGGRRGGGGGRGGRGGGGRGRR